MKRSFLLVCGVTCLAVLTACDSSTPAKHGADAFPIGTEAERQASFEAITERRHQGLSPFPPPESPVTWDEWVAYERPLREEIYPAYLAYHESRYDIFYRRMLPDMSLWRAEDFHPPEYFLAPRVAFCDLPKADRDRMDEALSKVMLGSVTEDTKELIETFLPYARRGVTYAQSVLGSYCGLSSEEEQALGFSAMESMQWARRGSINGDSWSMRKLAVCLERTIERHRDDDRHSDKPGVYYTSFLYDEMIYWDTRAAEKLDTWAMTSLMLDSRNLFTYGSPEANKLHQYQWQRVEDIMLIFFGGSDAAYPGGIDAELVARNRDMTPEQVAEGEAMVKAFLAERLELLRTYGSDSAACFTPQERRERLHYDALNAELAQYDLYVEPPGEDEPEGEFSR